MAARPLVRHTPRLVTACTLLLVLALLHTSVLAVASADRQPTPAGGDVNDVSADDRSCSVPVECTAGEPGTCSSRAAAEADAHAARGAPAHSTAFTSTEALTLRRLPGRTGEAPLVASTFRFRTGWAYTTPVSATAQRQLFTHYSHLARPLGRVIERHRVHEMRLALSAGRWRPEWGTAPGPVGAQLLVWLAKRGNATRSNTPGESAGTDTDTDAAHIDGFTNALAGLYCASLNLMKPDTMVSPDPERGFRPHSPHLWSSRPPAPERRRRHHRDRRSGVGAATPTASEAEAASQRCGFSGSGAWTGSLGRGGAPLSRDGGGGDACVAAAPLVGTLPREAVCTENLTPLLRLLPCRQRAGLATLLNPLKVFDSQYHSLQVDVHHECLTEACTQRELVVTHSVTAVLQLEPDTPKHAPWDLDTLFGRKLTSLCPRSASTRVLVQSITHNEGAGVNLGQGSVPGAPPSASCGDDRHDTHDTLESEAVVEPHGVDMRAGGAVVLELVSAAGHDGLLGDAGTPHVDDATVGDTAGCGDAAVVPVGRAAQLELRVEPATDTAGSCVGGHTLARVPVTVRRYLSGSGLVRRGLNVEVHNAGAHAGAGPVNVTLLDVVPAFMRPYLHTHVATLRCDEGGVVGQWQAPYCPHVVTYRADPARLTGPPTVLSMLVSVPPRCVLHMSMEYDLAFLPVEAYPADPARGFDLPPATWWATSLDPAHLHPHYTSPMLVDVPTPDFTMPYNVITLTSSVATFFIGSMFNLLARKRRLGSAAKPATPDNAPRRRCGRCSRNKS